MKIAKQYSSGLRRGVLLVVIGALAACGQSTQNQARTTEQASPVSPKAQGESLSSNRLPAVAGLFYPKDAKTLESTVDRLLASAPDTKLDGVRALICPHAGYEYSGPVAARSYKQVSGREFKTVIILAASHYALFSGVSVPATSAYETPLGIVPVSGKARELAQHAPFVLEPRCLVQRPSWSGMASKPAPANGADTPETWEHSVEVQVPFLQRALKDFEILPVMFGNADPEQVAAALAPLVDEQTLVVASTDLSHYHPYEEARRIDQETARLICSRDTKGLEAPGAEERACGRLPVLTVMHLAALKGWKPQLLDYRNSGDTAGEKSRVVGYAAVAFTDSGKRNGSAGKPQQAAQFSATERSYLLGLARKTLAGVAAGGPLPQVSADSAPAACRASKGCFVTLTREGLLRGCIGNIMPNGPLYQAVIDNTRSAALRDPRFTPVTADEAPKLHIEVSVLTVPEPLPFASPEDLLARLQPHKHGVVLKIGQRSATFLPQVWEQLPDKKDFLAHLSAKAGCAPDAWRGKDVTVLIYHAEAFEE